MRYSEASSQLLILCEAPASPSGPHYDDGLRNIEFVKDEAALELLLKENRNFNIDLHFRPVSLFLSPALLTRV